MKKQWAVNGRKPFIDRVGGIINKDGLSKEEVKNLFLNKDNNTLSAENLLSFEEINEQIWDIGAEVFLPCAASRLISQKHAERLVSGGLVIIAPGANIPFDDLNIIYGDICEYVDSKVALIPDFMANCGMSRTFSYLMQDDAKIEVPAIFTITLILCIVGVYIATGSLFGVAVMFVFAFIGYLMNVFGYSVIVFIIGFFLGERIELTFAQSLTIMDGNPMVLLSHPIALFFFVLALGTAYYMGFQPGKRRAR